MVAVVAALPTALCAAEQVSLEAFARPSKFSQPSLSPDGKYIGFLREIDGIRRFCIADVETMKMQALDLGEAGPGPFAGKDVYSHRWIGPRRVVVQSAVGWLSVDRDLKDARPLSGELHRQKRKVNQTNFLPLGIIHTFDDDHDVLVTVMRYQGLEVDKLNTISGNVSTVAKNPGNVQQWLADNQGRVRLGVAREGDTISFIYREDDEHPWRKTATFGVDAHVRPMAFSEDGKMIYTAARSQTGTWSLHQYDPEKGELGAVVWSGPWDIVGILKNITTRSLIGVIYFDGCERTVWFDPKYQALQETVDAALPDTANLIRFVRNDGQKSLVISFSDRHPESICLLDVEKNDLTKLWDSRAHIRPDAMAKMRPVKYVARDGLEINGYLTVPEGIKPVQMPTVVLPHGNALGGRDVWGFQPLVQMLASRGYAVFQPNYRGSSGYGQDFVEKGRHEMAGKAQQDIEDGVRWLISNKLSDPNRIAIMGERFGGYSALLGLARTPDLYRCGISLRGFFDIGDELEKADPVVSFGAERMRERWTDLMGKLDREAAKKISPTHLADAITSPVMMVYLDSKITKLDYGQALKMAAALRKCGRSPELVPLSMESKDHVRGVVQVETLAAIEAFLAKHLGSAVAETSAPATAEGIVQK